MNGDRLGVQDDRLRPLARGRRADGHADLVGVGEEQARLDPQDDDPRLALVAGMAFDVGPAVRLVGRAGQLGHVRARRPVGQEHERAADPDDQPRQGVEDQHAGHRRDRRQEVRPGRHPDPPGALAGDPVEPAKRREVDQLDHRGDHHGGQRGLGQLLEEGGQEEQGDDRQGRHDQARDLAPGAGAAVDRGLRERAVDDHPAGQSRGQVGRAEAEELGARVDRVVVLRGVRLGRAEALGEPDQQHPDGAAEQGQVVAAAHVRRAQRGQARRDVADDVHAVLVEVEDVDRGDPEGHRHERRRHHRQPALEAEHQGQRQHADGERPPLGVAEVRDQVPELLEEVTRALVDPEQRRQLADDDRRAPGRSRTP